MISNSSSFVAGNTVAGDNDTQASTKNSERIIRAIRFVSHFKSPTAMETVKSSVT